MNDYLLPLPDILFYSTMLWIPCGKGAVDPRPERALREKEGSDPTGLRSDIRAVITSVNPMRPSVRLPKT